MSVEPIHLRITPREPSPRHDTEPREAFWTIARNETDSNEAVSSLEARLCREFGGELRNALLQELAEPLRTLDSELFPGSLRDFEHWAFRFMDGPRPEREWYRYQFAEVFSRLVERRQQVIRESPSLRRVQERLAAAAGITFSTRIAGYASLNLDLVTSSLKQVAAAFEDDFDSFRVFLEAFVPVAFAGVFSESSADRLAFTVAVPASVERAFREAGTQRQTLVPVAEPIAAGPTSSRERAEWLWRLANGSLLVPLLLALLVMYHGIKMLGDIRAAQDEALKPVLEHQLKLLEEDRLRLSQQVVAPPRSERPPAQPAPQGE